jgi:hypothetical protein
MAGKKEDKSSDVKENGSLPINTKEQTAQWSASQMWETYQNEYVKAINEICYDDSFDVLYNDIEDGGKNNENLLYGNPNWVKASLVRRQLNTIQVEHLDDTKSRWIELLKNASMSREDYAKQNLPVPENFATLNQERKDAEKQYYEDACQIMFQIKVDDKPERGLTLDDYHRLERNEMKFAVDAVHLSLNKALPKKAKTSQNLYT